MPSDLQNSHFRRPHWYMTPPHQRTPTNIGIMFNTHRRRRRDETVELRRVGGPSAVRRQSWPSLQFPVLTTDKWRHNDVIVENNCKKITNITLHSRFECLQTCSVICYVISYFYSIGCRIVNLVTAIGCVQIAESVGSRRELVADLCTHRRRDATKQFLRVGVGGVYWARSHRPWATFLPLAVGYICNYAFQSILKQSRLKTRASMLNKSTRKNSI